MGETRTIRFAPDDSGRFLTGGLKQVAELWDVTTGSKLQTFRGHTGTVIASSWSRDSRTIATASYDKTARVWDVATGKTIGDPMLHLADPSHLEISLDGKRLATVARDGTARLWDPGTSAAVSPLLRQGQSCTTVRFSADGSVFFVHDHDGFRFWDTATALPVTIHYPEPVGVER